MNLKATAVMSALVASACVSGSTVPEGTENDPVFVQKFKCTTGKPKPGNPTMRVKSKIATVTKVGEAVFTAGHVPQGCLNEVEHLAFPNIDLAILIAEPITSCRSPRVGELVKFSGFPGTKTDGRTPRSLPRLETTEGSVTAVDQVLFSITSQGTMRPLHRHATTEISFVRGGYSGGAVTSLETGEFLGIISTGAMWRSEGSFVPANVICEKLEEVL